MDKKTFYILNLTWGILTNIFGGIVAVVLLCTKHKPTRHGGCLCFAVTESRDGFSLGLFIFVGKNATERTKNHEFGHAIQNAKYGIGHFVLSCGSFLRYWYRKIYKAIPHKKDLPSYDSWWFEGQATEWGNKYIKDWT